MLAYLCISFKIISRTGLQRNTILWIIWLVGAGYAYIHNDRHGMTFCSVYLCSIIYYDVFTVRWSTAMRRGCHRLVVIVIFLHSQATAAMYVLYMPRLFTYMPTINIKRPTVRPVPDKSKDSSG